MTPVVIWSFTSSVVSLLSLAFAFYSMRRASYFKRELDLEIAKRATPTFTVTKAEWGNQHKQVRIEDAFGLMPPNALALYLCPDTLRPYTTNQKADIVAGPKFINITYSSGPNSGSLRRKEGEWIILPEDPVLLKKSEDNYALYLKESEEAHRLKVAERDALTAVTKLERQVKKQNLVDSKNVLFWMQLECADLQSLCKSLDGTNDPLRFPPFKAYSLKQKVEQLARIKALVPALGELKISTLSETSSLLEIISAAEQMKNRLEQVFSSVVP